MNFLGKEYSPMKKFWTLIFVALCSFGVVTIASVVFVLLFQKGGNLSENVTATIILQALSTIFSFGLPMLIFHLYFGNKQEIIDTFNRKSHWLGFLLAVALIFMSNFLVSIFSTQNTDDIIQQWISKADFGGYILILFVVAVLPAIFEEWFFRAGVQKLLIQATKNAWIGIVLASMLFSLVHFDMSNFIARTILGFVLGIIYHYSNNIWTNILAHFLNNATVVTILYLGLEESLQSDSAINASSIIMAIVSALCIGAYIVFYERKNKSKEKITEPKE